MLNLQKVLTPRLLSILSSIFPVAVVILLVFAALFIKPVVSVPHLDPLPIHPRDAFYAGATNAQGSIWMAGRDGKIIFSNKNLSNWQIQDLPVLSNWQSIEYFSEKNLIAVGNLSEIVITTDEGKNWKSVELLEELGLTGIKFLRVKFHPNHGIWILGEFGTVLRSLDGAKTWKKLGSKSDVAWNDIAFSAKGISIVGEFGKSIFSTDQGNSWKVVKTPITSSLMALAIKDDGVGYSVGLEGKVLRTLDGGQSWQNSESITKSHLFAITYFNNDFYVGGDQGFIAKKDSAKSWKLLSEKSGDLSWKTDFIKSGDQLVVVGGRPLVLNDEKILFLNSNRIESNQ
jgi:photosystem II stability/assembly factor-like uncharacterized protein